MGAGWGSFAGDNNQHAAAVVTAIHSKEKKMIRPRMGDWPETTPLVLHATVTNM